MYLCAIHVSCGYTRCCVFDGEVKIKPKSTYPGSYSCSNMSVAVPFPVTTHSLFFFPISIM